MAETEDLYALLGVTPAATPDEIAQAYAARVAASTSDPALMLRLANAFQALLDPVRRADYDRARASSPATVVAPPPAPPPVSPVAPPAAPMAGPAPTVPPGQWTAPISSESGTASPTDFQSPAPAGPLGAAPDAAAPGVTAPVEPSPPSDPNRTEVVAWPPGAGPDDLTQRPASVTCPVCGVSNTPAPPPAESYCQDCGFLLGQTPGEGEVASTAGVRLVSADGSREFVLSPGTSAVGRQDAEVLLVDGTVSRLHARLYVEDGRLSVEDANSTNGSRVNGIRLEPGKRAPVSDGDEVQFGQISLRVRGAAAPTESGPTGTIVESGGRATAAAPPTSPEIARLVSLPAGTVYPIYSFPAAVGRRADSAIMINDPYVSGKHAELIEDGGLITVHDLGSTNGTVVGSEMLDRGASAPLPPGGIVQFGKQRFRFEKTGASGAASEAETAPETEAANSAAAPMSAEPIEPASEEDTVTIPTFGKVEDAGPAPDAEEKTGTDENERPAVG